jgi:hypothetical protein
MVITRDSKKFHRIGYDEKNRNLFVSFRNSDTYDYYDVPPEIYERLKSSKNMDLHFERNIKGKFRYDKRWN